MIKLDVTRNGEGKIISYKVSGHAGFGEEGQDIICAAVSALTQAAGLALERHLQLKLTSKYDLKAGVLEVALNSAPNDLTEAVLSTMYYGVKSIQSQNQKYVRIIEHRR